MGHATNDGYTNVRDSAHDYETQRRDDRLVLLRDPRLRRHARARRRSGAGCPQALPPYQSAAPRADYTGTAGPTARPRRRPRASRATRSATRSGWRWSTRRWPARTRVITGNAVPGATLKITKDFNLYTTRSSSNTTPASTHLAAAGDPDAPRVLDDGPGLGKFTWDVNPSVRPVPAYRRRRRARRPERLLPESWTITCTAADGTLLGRPRSLVDKGDVGQHSLVHAGRRRRLGAGHARR